MLFLEELMPNMTVASDVICIECCKQLDNYQKYSHKIKKIKETFESFVTNDIKEEIDFQLPLEIYQETDMLHEKSIKNEDIPFPVIDEREEFNCAECNKMFNDKIIFNVHMKYVHNLPRDAPIICEVCGDQIATKSLLLDHKNFCGGKKKFGSFWCKECGIEFKDIWRLQRHMRETRTHNNDYLLTLSNYRRAICDYCGKTMFRKKLRGHMRIHLNKRDFACRCCSRTFNQRGTLLKHMKVVHRDVMFGTYDVRCSFCGEHFDRLKKFEVHMDSMHLNEQN